jgi:hypothetical protein
MAGGGEEEVDEPPPHPSRVAVITIATTTPKNAAVFLDVINFGPTRPAHRDSPTKSALSGRRQSR